MGDQPVYRKKTKEKGQAAGLNEHNVSLPIKYVYDLNLCFNILSLPNEIHRRALPSPAGHHGDSGGSTLERVGLPGSDPTLTLSDV